MVKDPLVYSKKLDYIYCEFLVSFCVSLFTQDTRDSMRINQNHQKKLKYKSKSRSVENVKTIMYYTQNVWKMLVFIGDNSTKIRPFMGN